jgi:hypothetical protein
MSALWRACGRSRSGVLNGDLKRVLRGERQGKTSAHMVLRIARKNNNEINRFREDAPTKASDW